MNFAVLDFEMTCDGRQDGNRFIDDGRMKRFQREIISVGFVVFSDKYKIRKIYKSFIKPVHSSVLTEYCKNLTGISQTDVDSGKKCSDVFSEIFDICSKYFVDVIFVFGNYDKIGILSSAKWCRKNKEPVKKMYNISSKILDISPIIIETVGKKTKISPGLLKIADMLEIENSFQNHNAVNDAILLYKVCRKLKLKIRKVIE